MVYGSATQFQFLLILIHLVVSGNIETTNTFSSKFQVQAIPGMKAKRDETHKFCKLINVILWM